MRTIIFNGPTGSGKTTSASRLIEALLKKNGDQYTHLIAFTGTGAYTDDVESIRVPAHVKKIKTNIKVASMRKMHRAREITLLKLGRNGRRWAQQHKQIWFVDDAQGRLGLTLNNGLIAKLATTVRHLGIVLILCVHHVASFSQVIKSNMDACLVFCPRAKYLESAFSQDIPMLSIAKVKNAILEHTRQPFSSVVCCYLSKGMDQNYTAFLARPFTEPPLPITVKNAAEE